MHSEVAYASDEPKVAGALDALGYALNEFEENLGRLEGRIAGALRQPDVHAVDPSSEKPGAQSPVEQAVDRLEELNARLRVMIGRVTL